MKIEQKTVQVALGVGWGLWSMHSAIEVNLSQLSTMLKFTSSVVVTPNYITLDQAILYISPVDVLALYLFS